MCIYVVEGGDMPFLENRKKSMIVVIFTFIALEFSR